MKKKLGAILLVMVLAVALAIPMAVPVAAASSATLDPAWQVTQNRLSKSILPDGLNSALPSSHIAWGGFTTPVWTGGSTGIPPYNNAIPYWISGDTWLGWTAQPQNWITHTDAWLKTSINIPASWIVSSVKLVEKYKPSILSINDDLYVYVDGTYCAGGGTAGVPLVQGMIGTTPPDPSPYGTFVAALGVDWTAAPITGWYLNGGLSLPASLFTAGNHEIQILTEEFDESGGIAHPVFLIEYEEGPSIEVDKDYRYTNVCFERDNDGDGLFNEDPVDLIDNDLDGLIDEDPVDCPSGTNLGNPLPMNNGDYQLEAVIHPKNDTVKSYNPGQYYAVSTVNVLDDVDTLTIFEDWSACSVISALNPPNGGGCVVIVQVGGEINGVPVPDPLAAYQILNAKSDAVVVDTTLCTATATLEDVVAGTTIYMYVKFGPGLKGETWAGPYRPCINYNMASTLADPDPRELGDWIVASANLIVVEKD